MQNNIQLLKEIISDSEAELKLIIDDYSKVATATEVNRVIRWHKRTQEKLSVYLIDTEIFSFNGILNGANLLGKDDFITFQTKIAEYFIELNDDLCRVIAEIDETKMPEVEAFISYAWANDNVVFAIDQWLRNKGIKTRIDKRDFFAGSRIRDEIMRVMNECNVILVFHSSQSKDKPWIQFERELASDLEMHSKINGKEPPRIIYIVIDETPLPNISEKNRIAIMAKGKRFDAVCDEVFQNILRLPKTTPDIDLRKWVDYTF